jgi:hypothetical protein
MSEKTTEEQKKVSQERNKRVKAKNPEALAKALRDNLKRRKGAAEAR